MKVTVIPIVIGALGEITKGLIQGLQDLEIRGQKDTLLTTHIIEIGQNTKKCPSDLRRLAVAHTPLDHHQQMMLWKPFKGAKITKKKTKKKKTKTKIKEKPINYINEHNKLTQKEYKTKHDLLVKVIHWELCKKLKLDYTSKYYMHNLEYVLENETHKIF